MVCKVDGCVMNMFREGFCYEHYEQVFGENFYHIQTEGKEKRQRHTCKVEGCSGKVCAWGYCPKHYMRIKRHGSANIVLSTHPDDTELVRQKMIRNQKIIALRDEGKFYKEIARIMGVSPSEARYIYVKYKK